MAVMLKWEHLADHNRDYHIRLKYRDATALPDSYHIRNARMVLDGVSHYAEYPQGFQYDATNGASGISANAGQGADGGGNPQQYNVQTASVDTKGSGWIDLYWSDLPRAATSAIFHWDDAADIGPGGADTSEGQFEFVNGGGSTWNQVTAAAPVGWVSRSRDVTAAWNAQDAEFAEGHVEVNGVHQGDFSASAADDWVEVSVDVTTDWLGDGTDDVTIEYDAGNHTYHVRLLRVEDGATINYGEYPSGYAYDPATALGEPYFGQAAQGAGNAYQYNVQTGLVVNTDPLMSWFFTLPGIGTGFRLGLKFRQTN